MKRERLGYLALIACLLFTAACTEPEMPVVTSVSPAEGATNVSVHAVVSLTFSQNMDASSLEQGFKLLEAASQLPVSGAVVVRERMMSFTPSSSLTGSTSYQIKLAASVASTEGAELGEERVINFTTRAVTGADSVQLIEPKSFQGGRAELTLSNLGSGESVMIIPVHASQAVTHGYSTDGFDFTIRTSGILPLNSAAFKSKGRSGKTTVTREYKRHPRNFKQRWDALKKLTPEDKDEANAKRAAAPADFGSCRAPYSVGQQCTFQVLDYNDNFVDVTTTLKHVSASAFFFVDNSDIGDYSDLDLQQLGLSVENVAMPSNRAHFGELPDTDSNGKALVVLTRVLIDTVAKSGAFGYVAPWDLYPNGTVNGLPSNEGDIFYAASVGAVQALGYSRAEYFNQVMPETMVHELKHLIAIGGRLLNNRDTEELWLEEPSAVAAEELAGFGTLNGGTQYMAQFGLAHPENFRVRWDGRPSDSDEEYSMYGFNFLFLWRVAEARGHDPFWKQWISGPGTGIANLEAHAGVSFRSLMTDWAVTLGFDHRSRLEGYDYEAINLRDGSWTELGIKPLDATVSGSVRSAGYYLGSGLGANATIRFESSYSNPYFVVVRFPQ